MADIDEFCANCRKPLEGAIEIVKTTFRGTKVLFLKETPDRNWIRCIGCGFVVCKTCCQHPLTGYCNRCLEYIRKLSCGFPQTTIFTVSLSALRIWHEAVSNHNPQQHTGGINQ